MLPCCGAKWSHRTNIGGLKSNLTTEYATTGDDDFLRVEILDMLNTFIKYLALAGFEPTTISSEASALSTELQARSD